MGNHRDLHVLTHSFPTRRSSDLDWNDIQLSFLGLNGLSEIRNAGVARIRGIELDLGYRQNGFSINAGMSYNDAEIRRDFCAIANDAFDCTLPGADGADNALLAPKGAALPITPTFKGNIVARHELERRSVVLGTSVWIRSSLGGSRIT